MKKLILLIIAILTLILAGCTPETDLYEESKDIITSDETLELIDTNKVISLNSKIEMYEGKIKGSEVKMLIRNINTYNAQELFPTKLIVNDYANLNVILEDGNYTMGNIRDAGWYEISLIYGENAYISDININNIDEKENIENSNSGENISDNLTENDLIAKYKISDDYSINYDEWKKPEYNLIKTDKLVGNEVINVESDNENLELRIKINMARNEKYDYEYVESLNLYVNENEKVIEGDGNCFHASLIDLDANDGFKEIVVYYQDGAFCEAEIYRITKKGIELIKDKFSENWYDIGILYNESKKQYIIIDDTIPVAIECPVLGYYIYENGEFEHIERFLTGEKIEDENGDFNEAFRNVIFKEAEGAGFNKISIYESYEKYEDADYTLLSGAKMKFIRRYKEKDEDGRYITLYDIEIAEEYIFEYSEDEVKKELVIPAGTILKGLSIWTSM